MSQTYGVMKWGLIPVLAGILYLVIRGNSTSSVDNATQSLPAGEVAALSKVENSTQTKSGSPNSPITASLKTAWPVVDLDEVAEVDPFDRSMIFPEIETKDIPESSNETDRQSFVSSLGTTTRTTESLKVQIVFQTKFGTSAMVGDRLIRVGDSLDDGRRVIEITPESVVLSSSQVN